MRCSSVIGIRPSYSSATTASAASTPLSTSGVDLVLRGAFKRVVAGLILGLPLAVGAGRLIAAQLYGVSFWDPLALAIAGGSLATCAFFAALIPARRAGSISPMSALRTE